MRREGCEEGCFWSTVPSGCCAKAVCLHLSQHQEWGVKQNHVAVIALHNWGKSRSQFFELLKPLQILRMFVGQAVKRYKELWRVEDWTQLGCLKSARAEASIKTVWEQIRQNLLWKQKIMSRHIQCHTSSGTINT